jgi:hypothetical protein
MNNSSKALFKSMLSEVEKSGIDLNQFVTNQCRNLIKKPFFIEFVSGIVNNFLG